MSLQIPKLAALGFMKPQHDSLLDSLDALLSFALLCQLGHTMEVQTKDLTLMHDKLGLDTRLNQVELLERFRHITVANRVQYLWTGHLSYGLQGEGETVFKVHYWLYDTVRNQIVVDETATIPRRELALNAEPHLPLVDITEFNQLINQMTLDCCQAISETTSGRKIAPLSTSLQAIHCAMRAHHAIRYEEKIFFYEAALKEDAQMEVAYSQLARLYKNDQAYEKSVLCYREALKYAQGEARNKALYATEAGIACALLGRSELALQWWLRAIQYDHTYLNPYFNVANIYEDQNNLIEAESYFLKAQKLAPGDFRTYLNLGRIYSKLGEWQKALSQYHHQLETEEDDPWCHSDVATCYLNLGDLSNAQQHLQKTVALDPNGEAGQYAQLILSGIQ